ncbi:hypothetical protein [Chitinophaga defluvii]|uniref:Uncharacterized protein n=1 Tax=Chitinophaga defluvii TaxID=3163343 RepID=A0ABV2T3E4_9BACT
MNTSENQTERAMQEWLEKTLENELPADATAFNQEEQKELEAYRLLFRSLNEKPAVGPSYAFSANVLTKIQARKDYSVKLKWSFMLPLGILLVITVTYIAAAYFHSTFANAAISLVTQFRWQFIFGISCFLIIQYLDQQLVRKKILRH